jgi:hypothetical protein
MKNQQSLMHYSCIHTAQKKSSQIPAGLGSSRPTRIWDPEGRGFRWSNAELGGVPEGRETRQGVDSHCLTRRWSLAGWGTVFYT